MKKMLLAASVAVVGATAAFADGHSATLAATLERGTVKCGVNLGVPGFAVKLTANGWAWTLTSVKLLLLLFWVIPQL